MAVIRRLFIFGCFLSVFIGLFLSYQIYTYYYQPIVLVEDVRFRIEPGSSLRKILRELSSHQSIRPFSKKWYEVFIRMRANTTKIKAGEYILKKNMTGSELISQLIKGKVVLHSLTLIEGWTVKDCLKAIHKHNAIKKTLDTTDVAQIREKLSIAESSVEGFFFPETYYFPYGTTDRDFLLRAHQLMQRKLQVAWNARSPNLGVNSPYEALILASILEKESALVEEWPIISQVFHNRLKIKMRLQADPTVIYGLGADFSGRLNKDALKTPTPYNTYVIQGLPPSPIAMPSFGALLAACKPLSGDYLYFVAKDDGTHHFSSTLKEHESMVQKYQRRE